jgi:type IV pilus biogenesis protein CpaD/CtpE
MKTSFIIILALLLVGCASTQPSASPAPQSDASTRFEEIKIKAEKGDAKAQHNLGNCYRTGEGVAKDAVEAVKWYRKAAEQGFARAQYSLGPCYYTGEGVAKDIAEAVEWVRKAAQTRDPLTRRMASAGPFGEVIADFPT